jgi:hypothetical protein
MHLLYKPQPISDVLRDYITHINTLRGESVTAACVHSKHCTLGLSLGTSSRRMEPQICSFTYS